MHKNCGGIDIYESTPESLTFYFFCKPVTPKPLYYEVEICAEREKIVEKIEINCSSEYFNKREIFELREHIIQEVFSRDYNIKLDNSGNPCQYIISIEDLESCAYKKHTAEEIASFPQEIPEYKGLNSYNSENSVEHHLALKDVVLPFAITAALSTTIVYLNKEAAVTWIVSWIVPPNIPTVIATPLGIMNALNAELFTETAIAEVTDHTMELLPNANDVYEIFDATTVRGLIYLNTAEAMLEGQ